MDTTIPNLVKNLHVTAASIAASVAELNDDDPVAEEPITEALASGPELVVKALTKLQESLSASDKALKSYIEDAI